MMAIQQQQMIEQMRAQDELLRQKIMQLQLEEQSKAQQTEVLEQVQKGQVEDDEAQRVIQEKSAEMFNLMMEDDDPRFKESKFLGFLSKVMKGELKITDDQIVEVKPEEMKSEEQNNSWEYKM